MPGVDAKIDRAKIRICYSIAPEAHARISLYAEGLKGKFREAEFALKKILTLGSINTLTTTFSPQAEFEIEDEIRFFVDAYFAFLYSTLDVLSHIINQKYPLISDEKGVSFNNITAALERNQLGSLIQRRCSSFKTKKVFIELEAYRNCSTHRRLIYIELRTRRGTRGYPDIAPVNWIICDDPYSLNPTTKKNRDLIRYCELIYKRLCKEALSIFRAI